MTYPPPVISVSEIINLFPIQSIKVGIGGFPSEPTRIIDKQGVRWLCDDSVDSLIKFIQLVENNMSKFDWDDLFTITLLIIYCKINIMELYNEKISIMIFNKKINNKNIMAVIKKINEKLMMYNLNESLTLSILSCQNH